MNGELIAEQREKRAMFAFRMRVAVSPVSEADALQGAKVATSISRIEALSLLNPVPDPRLPWWKRSISSPWCDGPGRGN